MSTIRIALCLLFLGAVYALAAKLDEPSEPAAHRAASQPNAVCPAVC